VIPELRTRFNRDYSDEKYAALRELLDEQSGAKVEFRVSETPVFVPESLLQQMADEGAELAFRLIADANYLSAARRAIPQGYCVANETPHPHFLTADFALVRDECGELVPRLERSRRSRLCLGTRPCFVRLIDRFMAFRTRWVPFLASSMRQVIGIF
jgi:hypothetical protein